MSNISRTVNSARRSRGFTLVELLVVIGIIAVLVGLLLPALGSARKQAWQVTCAANLRQMGIAMTMYTQETKYYPGHQNYRSGISSAYAVWPTRLRKYMKGSQGVFRCPTQSTEYEWKPGMSSMDLNGTASSVANYTDSGFGYELGEALLLVNSTHFSYGYNDWGTGQVYPANTITMDTNPGGLGGTKFQQGLGGDVNDPHGNELKATRVHRPAEVIAIADNTPDGTYDFNIDPRNPNELPGKIHKGGANFLYCDGHVTSHAQKEVILVKFTPSGSVGGYITSSSPGNAWFEIAPQWNNDNKAH